ncbi:TatD family hydrolase [Xanthomonas campestris]|uniref:TatD family hydrolase n=1 Tax=Xanthomonas campestris TaxID=339 RepID=UPI00096D5E01|nr:TatD family hydrolase [Xanthomonas campestris]MCF8827052.1 TatD family hydrolase [Xanthomonas campestris pv. raphani]MEA9842182.1 TatD family hydrolase [Xanthomonas campestris pv. raphani]MEA9875432.1 TatD family hydrolase [Xanthomonas campestris pv. raphani]MEA9891928.1 TatD family hydrolase [Xanthomonas campestris pv. raphani]MEA9932913.1 TatD family hydrolase [Xanthomonas campestris pv. raphani]
MRLIDSHCHLDASEFDADRAAVIARAQAAGVMQQVVPAITAASWPGLREACALAPGLHPAYGLHPTFLDQHRPEHLELLAEWIARERPCAIGECGLDFFLDGLDAQTQRHYFDGQLQLAKRFDLPLIVHARRAVEEVIARIKAVGGIRGVVHSFAGSPEQAQQLWKLDFMIGLGGPVTYPRANRLRGLAAQMPLQHLLLETDAPDQPDAEIRGQRNEPARLRTVLECIAQLRGEPAEAIAAQTSANARRLFGLPA